jgi:hypothetical protein
VLVVVVVVVTVVVGSVVVAELAVAASNQPNAKSRSATTDLRATTMRIRDYVRRQPAATTSSGLRTLDNNGASSAKEKRGSV